MSQDSKPTLPALGEGTSGGYAPPAAPDRRSVNQSRPFAEEQPVTSGTFYESLINGLGNCCGAIGQFPCCICFPNPFKEVPQGTVGLVERFGRYYKTADPGLVKVNPYSERLHCTDTRVQIVPITGLTIVTKDNVSVGIEAVLYWFISNPYQARYGVASVSKALIERTQTTLRAVLGGRELQDLIENRGTIASAIATMIDMPAQAWGASIESILIKDIVLSRELQESLSSAATQKRIGQSKVIQAQAEVDAALLMREAADILNTPAAMQIRTLDSMVSMARTANAKVMFVPVSQDYSPGAINAFGGPGATVGINAIAPAGSDGGAASPAAGRRAGKQPEDHPAGLPSISQGVKDAALFAQLDHM
ncbi:hypothetical protein H4R21_005820 [Coemansia helicoidea]|uniref:Uncharacterized protein n=1 Tax=Coemansia helicoidea TaxID=1286919 RepID=A0ACC1KRH2_9FUNG|nr:hypothetical protein H4R21_005820 [Coemansia helicoidea]